MSQARVLTRVPVSIEFSEAMRHAVGYVLDGEYESGHDGSDLTVLDIWTSPAKVEGFSDRFCESEELEWARTEQARGA